MAHIEIVVIHDTYSVTLFTYIANDLWSMQDKVSEMEAKMPKIKEPVISMTERFMTVTEEIATRVAACGGDFSETLIRLGKEPSRYKSELQEIAEILATVYYTNIGFALPKGGAIHTLVVEVDESLDWTTALKQVGPSCLGYDRSVDRWVETRGPSLDDRIVQMSDKYPPQRGALPEHREVVLVNFGESFSGADIPPEVLNWGRQHKLLTASPRTIFALIGQYYRHAHPSNPSPPGTIYMTEACRFGPHDDRHVIWARTGHAGLYWTENCSPTYSKDAYFAFVRERDPLAK